MYNSMNILNATELYTLPGWILWYMNYISMKPLFKNLRKAMPSLSSYSIASSSDDHPQRSMDAMSLVTVASLWGVCCPLFSSFPLPQSLVLPWPLTVSPSYGSLLLFPLFLCGSHHQTASRGVCLTLGSWRLAGGEAMMKIDNNNKLLILL